MAKTTMSDARRVSGRDVRQMLTHGSPLEAHIRPRPEA
ncbi:hypothetical protein ACVILJ_001762 [Bradyrhizobium diazoefficiens]|jgi:hypothetical protein